MSNPWNWSDLRKLGSHIDAKGIAGHIDMSNPNASEKIKLLGADPGKITTKEQLVDFLKENGAPHAVGSSTSNTVTFSIRKPK